MAGQPPRYRPLKVSLTGKYGVGKTKIFNQIRGQPDSQRAEIDYHEHTVTVLEQTASNDEEEREVTLRIWDTAGLEQFESLTETHYRRSRAILAVFALNSEESFEWIETEVANILKDDHSPNAVFILVGNKADVHDSIEVPLPRIEDFMKNHPRIFKEYIQISALQPEDVCRVMEKVAQLILAENVTPNDKDSVDSIGRRVAPVKQCC